MPLAWKASGSTSPAVILKRLDWRAGCEKMSRKTPQAESVDV
jgi:hypothetical protein